MAKQTKEEEDRETYGRCAICKQILYEDEEGKEDVISYECQECTEIVCENCSLPLENISICKKCIEKVYKNNSQKETIYVDKIIEKEVKVFVDNNGQQIQKGYSFDQKTRFD